MTAWQPSLALLAVTLMAVPCVAAQETSAAAASMDRAWGMLSTNAAADKPSHDRIQALAALSTMEADPRAERLIGVAIVGRDMDVRTAAILAAGKTKNPQLIRSLRAALDDDEPQVAYAAAVTLWKMHDSSGEDLLLAVVAGDRSTKLGMMKTEKHKAAKEMHSPRAMAKIGLDQGSSYFLGPFGFGIRAIEFIHKNGGDPARASAVDLIAEEHTDNVHAALIDALSDHDFAVRAAAARGLGQWRGEATANQLLPLFDDDKLAVRLTAAAAYIRALQPHPSTEPEAETQPHVIRDIPPKLKDTQPVRRFANPLSPDATTPAPSSEKPVDGSAPNAAQPAPSPQPQ